MTPMTVPEILTASGLNKTQLSKRFGIPYKTVQNWCADGKEHRECPAYVRLMMQELLGL
jgi:transposase